jgi:di/tripeptidase
LVTLKKTTSKEIIKAFKGVPIVLLMEAVAITKIKEMRKAIKELWNNDEITLDGAMFINSDKHLREHFSNIFDGHNDYSFLRLSVNIPL